MYLISLENKLLYNIPKKNIMKVKSILFFVFFSCGLMPINIQAQESPVEYMDMLINPVEAQKRETWQYMKASMRGKSMRKQEKKRKALIKALEASAKEVTLVKAYKGDDSFKEAVLKYLRTSHSVINEDYSKIIDMEAVAEQSYDAMEAYLTAQELAGQKLDEAWDELEKANHTFAEANNIRLVKAEKDKLAKKIGRGNDVMGYYNDLFLIFFKGQHEEIYIDKAIAEGNVNSLEQSIVALSDAAKEGKETLKTVDSFHGDRSLINAVRTMHSFYAEAAKSLYPPIVDFYLKKDNFEKLQKQIESKKKRDVTREEADEFNTALKKYNSAVKDFNKYIDSLNKKRNTAYKEYSKQVDAFFGKHG